MLVIILSFLKLFRQLDEAVGIHGRMVLLRHCKWAPIPVRILFFLADFLTEYLLNDITESNYASFVEQPDVVLLDVKVVGE